MSDPQDPRTPETPGDDPRPEEGRTDLGQVVEGVREEVQELHDKLEDVVEQHLPKRVRWSAGRIATLILLSLFVLLVSGVIGGFLWLSRHSVWAAGELSRLLNQTLAEHSNVVLEVKDLRGNPLKRVTLISPRVRFRDADGPVLLEATSMTVSYTPWNLWTARRRSIEVVLEHPVIRLGRGPDGRLQLPEWRSGHNAKPSTREVEILLHVLGADVMVADTSWSITGGNLDAHVLTGQRTEITLKKMTWDRGPLNTRLQAFSGSVAMGDSVWLRLSELRTPDLALHGWANWVSGERPERRVHLDVERVEWKWLAKVFDNGVFNVPGEGRGSIDASGSTDWRGNASIAATWDSLPMTARSEFLYDHGALRVAPLDLRSPAGNLRGRFDYEKTQWLVAGEVSEANPKYWSAIQLHGWPEGRLSGNLRLTSAHRGTDTDMRLDAVLGRSVLAGWAADSGRVTVVSPFVGPDTFSVRAATRGGLMLIGGRLAPGGGWAGQWSATRVPLDEWPDGRASGIRGLLDRGSGTVASRDSGLVVTGTLEGSGTDWLGIHAAGWRLDDAHGVLLPRPRLMARSRLADAMFLGIHFDSIATPLAIGDQRLGLEDVRAAAGDTVITVAGETTWDPSGWQVSLSRAEAKSSQFDWVAEPPVAFSGDPHGVDFRRLVASDRGARLAMTGRWALPGGAYDWSASADSLDLGRLGLPLDLELEGHANARLHVTGAAGDPRWTMTGHVDRPGMQGQRLDTADLELEGRKSTLEVTHLTAALDGGHLDARGRFEDTAQPWPDTLNAGRVMHWLTTAAHWQGEVRADSMPIEPVAHLAPAAAGWGGRASGTLSVGGRPSQPELNLQARARPLRRDPLTLDEAEVHALYHDGELTVPDLRITLAHVDSHISGRMPLGLSVGSPIEVPDRPMEWHVELPKGDLALVPLFVPQLAQARGVVELHAEVGGTTRHPTFQGTAAVHGGVVVPAGREEVIEGVEAQLRLSQSEIQLVSFSARQGKRGTLSGQGAIHLAGSHLANYRFTLRVRDFTSGQSGLYAAQFSSIDSLVITNGPRVGGATVPHVEGAVEIERAVILFDFANQSENDKIAATSQPLYWTYRLRVHANNNLRWQPPDADIEFSADLLLEQTINSLIIYGDMNALRGTYHFLSNTFNVVKADLTFDNVGGVNPTIDAEATTRILPTQGGLGETVDASSSDVHTVTVTITGRSDQPNITFVTDRNDWDEARILRELTLGRFLDRGTVALGDPLDNWLTRKLNEQLSPVLSKAFLGYVNQWALEREQGGLFAGQGDVVLKVSSQLNPRILVNLYNTLPGFKRPVTTTAPLTDTFDRKVEAEYRLNRFFYVTTELAQRRAFSGGTVGSTTSGNTDFNVNLKARWEY